jgi:branched-chain amino acid transport system permease protein
MTRWQAVTSGTHPGPSARPVALGRLWPGYRPPQLAVAILILVIALPWLGLSPLWIRQAEIVAIFTLIVSGTNLSYGYAGELSLGQPAIFAVGAYAGGYMALNGANDLVFTLLVGGVAAAIAGLIIGIPGLRLSSWSLAMVSLFVVLLVPDLVSILQRYTGGLNDMTGIPAAKLFGNTLTAGEFYAACIVIAGLWLAFERNLILSRYGTTIHVLKASPVLTAALGNTVYWSKVQVYVLGSIPAGLAGVLFAYYDQFIAPSSFDFDVAIGILAASVLGGATTIYGAVLGAALLEIGPYEFASFQSYSLIVYGAMLLAGGLFLRDGIIGRLTVGRRYLLRRWPALAAADPTLPHLQVGKGREPTDPAVAPAELAGIPRDDRAPLVADQIGKNFGGVPALDGISISFQPGQVTALIGPNGSGKTTLLNVISGLVRPTAGSVTLGAHKLTGKPPQRVARLGVARTFQTPIVPEALSTIDSVAVARFRGDFVGLPRTVLRTPGFRNARERDHQAASAALAVVGLTGEAEATASSLPLGTRRRVEVARAIASNPRVLLLDEPASGLSEADVAQLGQLIRAVAATGAIVILVEHNFPFVLDTADTIHVISLGKVTVSGSPDVIRNDPQTIATYVGEPLVGMPEPPIGPAEKSPR